MRRRDLLKSALAIPLITPNVVGIPFDAQLLPSYAGPSLPTAPTGLAAVANANDTVSLSWTANPSGQAVTGYGVYREPYGSTSATLLATVSGTSYTDSSGSLVAGSSWTYYLTATNAAGTSPPSATASVTIPQPGAQLAILTLVNTSGSGQAAGSVTPIFGWAFKKGDVPSGTAPQFLVGGVAQPYSWGCQSYYSDGSLCWASFMLRTTVSVAGGGSLAVAVWNGGNAPAPSSRMLTEVYGQGIVVETTVIGKTTLSSTTLGLSAAWNAYLRSDGNNNAQYVYLDGAAGKVWRIETEFAQSAGGAAHGQLYCYHYVAALQDASGNLGGMRYLAKVAQPWYNVTSPAPAWYSYSAVAVAWTGGPGGSHALVWPFVSPTFTGSSGNGNLTAGTALNWYVGASDGANCVPGYVKGKTGTDTAVSTSQVYFAFAGPAVGGSTTFTLYESPSGGYQVTPNGTVSATFVPVPTVMCFGALFTATAAARWAFIQGTGSMGADATLRTQYDANYFHSTGMLPPPWDQTLAGTVADYNAGWAASYPSWAPTSSGPIKQAIGGTGGDYSIGPLTNYDAVHFFNQSVGGELVERSIAYASAFMMTCFKDRTTRQLANLSSAAYTGLPASSTDLCFLPSNNNAWAGTEFTNLGQIPSFETQFFFYESDTSHAPSFAYYATLVFGGPEFLDLLLERANAAALTYSAAWRNPTIPLATYNVVTSTDFGAGIRAMAWALRDRVYAANLAPALHPDGSQLSQYVTDSANGDANYPISILNATYLNSYCAANGLWQSIDTWGPGPQVGYSSGISFMSSLFSVAMCAAAYGRLRNAAALSWVEAWVGWLSHVVTTFGGYHLYAEYSHSFEPPRYNSGESATPISQDSHFAIPAVGAAGGMTWRTTSPAFTITNVASWGTTSYTPAAGDLWMFDDGSSANPVGFSTNVPYYARDLTNTTGSTWTFNLAATFGGTAILPSNSGTVGASSLGDFGGPWLVSASPPAASTGLIPIAYAPDSYLMYQSAFANWAQAVFSALGTTPPGGLAGLLAEVNARVAAEVANSDVAFTAEPLWKMQGSY
jgi:hypothetical protein